MMRSVSALGDAAFLLPVSLAFVGYLLLAGRLRLGLLLAFALVVGLGTILLAKFAFSACGSPVPHVDVTSPSGHAAFATLVYGALASAWARGRPPPVGAALAAAATLVVLAVGTSRIALGYHSVAEVVAGTGVGLASLWLFGWLRRPPGERPLTVVPVVVGLAVVGTAFLGRSLTFEHQIARTARDVTSLLEICTPPTGVTELRRSRM